MRLRMESPLVATAAPCTGPDHVLERVGRARLGRARRRRRAPRGGVRCAIIVAAPIGTESSGDGGRTRRRSWNDVSQRRVGSRGRVEQRQHAPAERREERGACRPQLQAQRPLLPLRLWHSSADGPPGRLPTQSAASAETHSEPTAPAVPEARAAHAKRPGEPQNGCADGARQLNGGARRRAVVRAAGAAAASHSGRYVCRAAKPCPARPPQRQQRERERQRDRWLSTWSDGGPAAAVRRQACLP